MTLRVALHHETRYAYDRSVALGPQVIRLRPAPHCRTPIRSFSLHVAPDGHFLNWQQDPHGNFLARVVFPEPADHLHVSVDLVADMEVLNPFDFFLEESANDFPFEYEPWLAEELLPYLKAMPAGRRLKRWLAAVPREPRPTVEFLFALNQRLYEDLEYVVRMEPGVQEPERTLELGRGSCRDSAWLLVQILRHLGIGARFASGYLIQLRADVESLDGPSGPEKDFTDLHAWAEAYVPGAGWIGLDPTSGLFAGEGHLPLACTPKPQSAAPITGLVGECEVEFSHTMEVERVEQSPRVTLPYDDGQWEAIDALGQAVDRRLAAGDVRLTMGGEPTFVSIDDMDGEEWNTAAVGPTKRVRAETLARRLRERFAPGGLLHYGQGKWYPGEPLPRWAFGIHWREDGVPLWQDPELIADEATDHAPEPAAAEALAGAVARRLGIDPSHVIPAYEDPLDVLRGEAALPENLSPTDPALAKDRDRARLVRTLSRGIGTPVAFALPVQVWNAAASGSGRRWISEKWRLRRGQLFLAPGDSPAGFRLPIGALPVIPAIDFPHVIAADPSVRRPPLLAPDPQRRPFRSGAEPPEPASGPSHPVRTALLVEPRDGRLCVFLPPVETAEDYVDLVAAVEDACAEHGTPIHLEGYPPPPDARLRVIQVTPDPGVIEVNVHPVASWKELASNTTELYEDARQARLGTEKFMVDGRHTGTGGGNHVVLGGATPADSPFLRRPDLLRSLLAYWLDHPALSYLFSGLFIGPTSQAPRVDEARDDALHELEIAFQQIPPPGGETPPPWRVDRIFRDLLTDATGNTHRAEFCIDKLYSPDSATGRLGLLELRSFEMPPHARMSLVQQLLVRALVLRCWEDPYRALPARLGTSLHDRYLLPHFLWRDLLDVLEDLGEHGLVFAPEWFGPHLEFRFPVLGRLQFEDVEIELRQALEPWHVLGEEGVAGATSRYVDSSLERIQVRVRGRVGGRHELACNGFRLPLCATGTPGEFVAGVRYRAWQPARCLHPTIPVHAPLIFDWFDTAAGRSIAGCQYHVAHPGGRAHETFPVNAFEAEGRRLARFFPFGHSPGLHALREPPVNRDFPLTLDLRRCGIASDRTSPS